MSEMPIDPDWDESRILYERARSTMDAGAISDAVILFQESIKLKPNAKALLLLGDCFMRLGRPIEAIIPLAASTTLNRQAIAPTLLAEVFFERGDLYRARQMLDLALERMPHYKRAQSQSVRVNEAIAERERDMGIDDPSSDDD